VLVVIDIYILYLSIFLFLCITYLFLFKKYYIYYRIRILKYLKLTYRRTRTVSDTILAPALVQHRLINFRDEMENGRISPAFVKKKKMFLQLAP
jgi:hypothetical protein